MIVLDSIPFSAQPPMIHEKSAEEMGSNPRLDRSRSRHEKTKRPVSLLVIAHE